MNKGITSVNGKSFKRVQKRTALKLFNNGKEIYLAPCKMRIDSPWCGLVGIDNKSDYDFNSHVASFEYYNCMNELGTYASYYIKD